MVDFTTWRSLIDGAGAIPDSVINHWPADEGSGQTLTDNVGSNDISLSFDRWVTDSEFEGGVAPDFNDADGDDGTADANPTTQAWSVKVVQDTAKTNGLILSNSDGNDPRLFYRDRNDKWVFDGGNAQIEVSESASTATGSPRTLICGSDGTTTFLYVYDSTKSEIGNASGSGALSSFGNTFYLGQEGGANANYWDGRIDQIMQHDKWLDSQQRSDLLANHY